MKNTAFVIGNGTSRSSVNLSALKAHGRVYGCNALYRDFTPDVLIATDKGISEEIQHSGYAKVNVFYTRSPLPKLGAKKIEYNWGWSSGPIALSYASASNAAKIYILGFDLSGVKGKFNNVYADTAHYKKSNETETYYGNWINQCYDIMARNKQKSYIRVVDSLAVIPPKFENLSNLNHITVDEFCGSFNI